MNVLDAKKSLNKTFSIKEIDIDIKRLLQFKDLDKIKDMEIQELLGELYNDKHEFEEARNFFKLAADQGYANAQFMLGRMLYRGEGGDTYHNQAKKMFELAAEQGNERAKIFLDYMLFNND